MTGGATVCGDPTGAAPGGKGEAHGRLGDAVQ